MSIVPRIVLVTGLAIGGAFAVAASVPAASADTLEDALVRFADTPEEHKALADYYKAKAADARAEAEAHRKMGKTYSGQKAQQVQAMATHCEKLAAAQDELAKQYDDLAAGHLAMAK